MLKNGFVMKLKKLLVLWETSGYFKERYPFLVIMNMVVLG